MAQWWEGGAAEPELAPVALYQRGRRAIRQAAGPALQGALSSACVELGGKHGKHYVPELSRIPWFTNTKMHSSPGFPCAPLQSQGLILAAQGQGTHWNRSESLCSVHGQPQRLHPGGGRPAPTFPGAPCSLASSLSTPTSMSTTTASPGTLFCTLAGKQGLPTGRHMVTNQSPAGSCRCRVFWVLSQATRQVHPCTG